MTESSHLHHRWHTLFHLLIQPAVVLAFATYLHNAAHHYLEEDERLKRIFTNDWYLHLATHYVAEWLIFLGVIVAAKFLMMLFGSIRRSPVSFTLALAAIMVVGISLRALNAPALEQGLLAALMTIMLTIIALGIQMLLIAADPEDDEADDYEPGPFEQSSPEDTTPRSERIKNATELLFLAVLPCFWIAWTIAFRYGLIGVICAAIFSFMYGSLILIMTSLGFHYSGPNAIRIRINPMAIGYFPEGYGGYVAPEVTSPPKKDGERPATDK